MTMLITLWVETEWRARVGVRLTYPLPVAKLQGSQAGVEGIEDPARRGGHGHRPSARQRPLERRGAPGAHPRGAGDREGVAILKPGLAWGPFPPTGPAPRPARPEPRRGLSYYRTKVNTS
jgi:hypothetical protein